MEYKEKLINNQSLIAKLSSPTLRQLLIELIQKKKELDVQKLFNDYYGNNRTDREEECVLIDHIQQSNEFRELIVDLLEIISNHEESENVNKSL